MRWTLFCAALDKYLNFPHIYPISVNLVIVVPHSPDLQKLQISEESNKIMAQYIGPAFKGGGGDTKSPNLEPKQRLYRKPKWNLTLFFKLGKTG